MLIPGARVPRAPAKLVSVGERVFPHLAAALAEIPRRHRTQLTSVEKAQAETIRRAGRRLAAIEKRLASEDLMVEGSMGQQRDHPLLGVEAKLRKEISDGLRRLDLAVAQRASFERIREMTREPR